MQDLACKIISQQEFFRYGQQGNTEELTLHDPLKQVAIVYACVMARATPLAMCPLKVYTRDKDGEPVEAQGSPLDSLLWRPNPITSRYQLIQAWEMSMCVHGESFILKEATNQNAVPTALWLLPPKLMEAETDSKGVPKKWIYTANKSGTPVAYEPWQIIHDKFADPDNPTRGLSPLKAPYVDIAQEFDVTRWNRAFLSNDCDPGGRYEFEGGAPMSQEQASQILRHHKDKFSGPNNTGKAQVDMGGMKYNRAPIAHKDMSFGEQRDFNLRAVKMALGVPTAALGITEDIPYAAFKGQMRAFWECQLIPRTKGMEDVLWSSWLHDFDGGKYEILFDLKEVSALREDITEKVPAVAPLFNAGVPVSEINRLLNLGIEEYEGWDVGYLSAGLIVAGEEPPPPVAPPAFPPKAEEPEEEETEEKSLKDKVEFADFSPEEIAEAKSWDSQVIRPNEKSFGTQWRKWCLAHRNASLDAFREATGWDGEEKSGGVQVSEKAKGDERAAAGAFGAMPPEDKLFQKLVEGALPIYERAIVDGAGNMATRIGTEAQITQLRGELAKWVQEVCIQTRLKGATNYVREVLRESIAEGVENGETLYEIAGRIKSVHKAAGNRAMVISRTEVGRAANKGAMEEATESGVVKAQRWNAAMDAATRATHRAAHRQERALGSPFSVGDSALMYPGDPSGPPEEVCACRCALSPVLKDMDEIEVPFLD